MKYMFSSSEELEDILTQLSDNFSDQAILDLPDLFGTALDEQRPPSQPAHGGQMVPELLSEWNEKMVNFNPDDMIAFELQPG